MSTSHPRTEESMGELFKQLSNDLTLLMRQELALARAEMTEKGRRAGLGAGLLGGAGLFAFVALLALCTTVIALLATTMKVWIAALIVTGVLVLIAAVFALVGKREINEATPPTPEQTTETLKEDAQWAQTRLPSGNR